jgi:ElaB/YqjD/DUF883 family membrane-anchored ribosome-binding protein
MTEDHSESISLHPEHEKLKSAIQKLRTELSMLVTERDDLLYQECKNIEMQYMLAVGFLEYQAFELECAVRRLQRKIELIQAKINRQEAVDLPKIERLLDFEFAEYQEQLQEQVRKMNEAVERSQAQPLTGEETRKIKNLYRSIMKTLHPDLNPDLSQEKLELFYRAVEAYERADLDEMTLIAAILADFEPSAVSAESFEKLNEEKDRLNQLLKQVKDQIIQIKSQFPYTMKTFIQSPGKIEARRKEINAAIDELNDVYNAYTARIDQILGESDG